MGLSDIYFFLLWAKVHEIPENIGLFLHWYPLNRQALEKPSQISFLQILVLFLGTGSIRFVLGRAYERGWMMVGGQVPARHVVIVRVRLRLQTGILSTEFCLSL